ncbi:hypothetical protein JOC85_002366 [Bacillus mesophilus]|uniref:Uncharacterized protein n=1 Tax=Bacillus mesophilus TaxID=1808955 RepID=A0A6M0Q7B8_9BACI|nr:hypothetical protein [Bacillus mesophilus]MBM7661563.1 hypothetical protein [Bacillus mesophilus]NEY72232.1 hypothetical protein [Bacillus mesophilus]
MRFKGWVLGGSVGLIVILLLVYYGGGFLKSNIGIGYTEEELSQQAEKSLGWLQMQLDMLDDPVDVEKVLGSTEEPSYRLIPSYYIPSSDPMSHTGIERRSWLYDNALAVIAFSLAGDQKRASTILSSLEELQNEDGSFAFAYDVFSGPIDESKRSGSIAWLGDAIVKYEVAFGDSSYRDIAISIADYLLGQQDQKTGSIKGGPDVEWYSTEHNIDAYFFFRDLGRLTGESHYIQVSENISSALLSHHWNDSEGRFNQGINDTAEALDANSWGSIFLMAVHQEELAQSPIDYLERFEVHDASLVTSMDQIKYNTTYQTQAVLTGYKPYAAGYEQPPTIVWTEGTWGVINLLLRREEPVHHLLTSMFAMQEADQHGGLVYSNERHESEPYNFYVWPAVAGTAWEYITLTNPRFIWDDTIVE